MKRVWKNQRYHNYNHCPSSKDESHSNNQHHPTYVDGFYAAHTRTSDMEATQRRKLVVSKREHITFWEFTMLAAMYREARMNISPVLIRTAKTDGSYDSICPDCFITASHAATETELSEQDKATASLKMAASVMGDAGQATDSVPTVAQSSCWKRYRSDKRIDAQSDAGTASVI
jgi:hypothetical protein